MLIGEFQHSIDEKGRLIMPSKLRDALGDQFFITKGLDGCLFVFPESEWEELSRKISTLDLANREARSFSRIFFAGAMETSLDKQGRVLITQSLREFAQLQKEVVIIGVSSRAEIWSKERWNQCNSMDSIEYDLLASHLQDLGGQHGL